MQWLKDLALSRQPEAKRCFCACRFDFRGAEISHSATLHVILACSRLGFSWLFFIFFVLVSTVQEAQWLTAMRMSNTCFGLTTTFISPHPNALGPGSEEGWLFAALQKRSAAFVFCQHCGICCVLSALTFKSLESVLVDLQPCLINLSLTPLVNKLILNEKGYLPHTHVRAELCISIISCCVSPDGRSLGVDFGVSCLMWGRVDVFAAIFPCSPVLGFALWSITDLREWAAQGDSVLPAGRRLMGRELNSVFWGWWSNATA